MSVQGNAEVHRRLARSPLLYAGAAAILLAAFALKDVRIRFAQRPVAGIESIASLRERNDLNLVFILIDTLRANRLSGYGYERATSPAMDALAASGVRFARVESQSSFTKVSMASLWTGLYPERTGVLRFRHALPDEAVTPAERLREAGFRTAGIFRNGWVAPNFHFDQGFDLYLRPRPSRTPERFERHNPSAHPLAGTDLDATESAVEFLRHPPDGRFFLYVHYMDVHQYVYDAESTLFGTSYSDAYDNAIHWVDRNVAHLVGTLQRRGLLDRTVVVIASDHAEAFYEHGQEGHARNLYREVTEVPLILLLPFRLEPGLVVNERVANVDIWPTLLELFGLPPLPGAEGRSLVPLMLRAAGRDDAGGASLAERPIFAQLDRSWAREDAEPNPIVSVVKDPFRLIYPINAPERPELYDRAADPLERDNVADGRPQVVAELTREVEGYLARPRARWGEAPEVEIDEMRAGQLRALGYAVDAGGELERLPARDLRERSP